VSRLVFHALVCLSVAKLPFIIYVLALEGEHSNLVREGVRVLLAFNALVHGCLRDNRTDLRSIIPASCLNVRFWHKLDITAVLIHVRYWGQSGHRLNVL
jgi:hypothetical protein